MEAGDTAKPKETHRTGQGPATGSPGPQQHTPDHLWKLTGLEDFEEESLCGLRAEAVVAAPSQAAWTHAHPAEARAGAQNSTGLGERAVRTALGDQNLQEWHDLDARSQSDGWRLKNTFRKGQRSPACTWRQRRKDNRPLCWLSCPVGPGRKTGESVKPSRRRHRAARRPRCPGVRPPCPTAGRPPRCCFSTHSMAPSAPTSGAVSLRTQSPPGQNAEAAAGPADSTGSGCDGVQTAREGRGAQPCSVSGRGILPRKINASAYARC